MVRLLQYVYRNMGHFMTVYGLFMATQLQAASTFQNSKNGYPKATVLYDMLCGSQTEPPSGTTPKPTPKGAQDNAEI